MTFRRIFVAIGCVLFSPLCQANSSLGEVNIELRGNVVDFSCAVIAGDSNKSVNLGIWPTKQLHAAGDATQPVSFSLKLEGCPPGSASITFSGTPAPDSALLALNDTVMTQKLAIEIRDSDLRRLPLEQASKAVDIDNNGNATLKFYANYIALADGVQPGLANSDATFLINYN
ncbi:fimbria assembly protein [Salmonella enterica]|uniref:Fimbria assembly protein n=9 Tax=Salmonella enterica TaxID=28901 RepID=A0A702LF30_SALHO|nr:fimbria assembly protein [Salmonella enterica]EAA3681717.1 fimbriae assembly protein [Salmonella enterica subsp. houtenae]EAA7383417.1 fimbriae assembly protein [Salmonella enterica subsp. enterica]EAU5128885.1 fimbriae assembly protein [Salmonella enterica subsp. enterica serovar Oranienburg]EBH8100871.1 fimbriae assembly protein [Salmonella enterica subsp. houtenae serovar O:11:g,z25:-]EBI0038177.1 fimbriae assembly protein [Salmonella enterica subsp. diarizonae serovar 61:k:z35]EBI03485